MRGRLLAARFGTLLRVAAALTIVVCANILAERLSRSPSAAWFPWRADITEAKLFTFHPKTMEMLHALDDVVHVAFYNTGDWPLRLQVEEERIRDFMGEVVRLSKGLVIFEEIDPFDGQVEDEKKRMETIARLQQSGVYAREYSSGKAMETAKQGYFSIAVEHKGGRELIRDPDSPASLEYRLMSAINKLSRPRKRIGVLAPNPKSTLESDFPQLFHEIGSYATPHKIFPFRVIPGQPEDYAINTNLDALLILTPRGLSKQTLESIDRHVMSGKPLIAVVDGFVAMQANAWVPNSSHLIDLLAHYGIRVSKSIAFETQSNLMFQEAVQLGPGQAVPVGNYYKFWTLRDTYAQDNDITAGLYNTPFHYATPLDPSEQKSDSVKLIPLVTTTDQGGRDVAADDEPILSPLPNPRRVFNKATLGKQTLVMEAVGRFPRYQPEQRPEDKLDPTLGFQREVEGELGMAETDTRPAESPDGTRVIVVGGSHFLRDPESYVYASSLMHNILEQATYGSSLSELRGERNVARPLRAGLKEADKVRYRWTALLALPAAVALLSACGALGRRVVRRARARALMSAGN